MRCNGRALSVSVLVSLALSVFTPASAQESANRPTVLNNPVVGRVMQFDISRPLRDMATELPPPPGFHEAAPVKRPHLHSLMAAAQANDQVRDGALQPAAGSPVRATVGLNLLGVGSGFPAYSVPDAPPDVNLAVGDTQVVQWVNVSYAIFDKTTGAVIAGPTLGNAFWSGFGGGCQNNNSGDVIIQWDKLAHRWVAAQNVFSSPYLTCIAVSTTPDATGTYYRYAFSQPGFPDYPKWGIWSDGYYQSQNNFGSTGSSFSGAYVCAYDRNKMLAGNSSPQQICFGAASFDNSLLPADLDSAATPPSSGEPEVFLGSVDESTSTLYEYLFHVDFTTPSNSTFTGVGGTMPIAVAQYALSCGGFGACIPQPGVTDQLDSLGDRLMYRLTYRNFSDHQSWLVSHSVNAGNSVGERWYEFRAAEGSTSLSVYQQGTFAPDSSYRWMGSLAMDSAQDIALGYSLSSSSLYPSISYTGRVATDPLGSMESEASIISGTGAQSDTGNRWGDYTSMALDAADDCTFWFTAEYGTVTGTFDWSTRLASLKFPNCGAPVADFSISALPGSVALVQGNQGTVTITTTVSNGFNNSVALSASGMPAGVTVSLNHGTIAAPGNGTAIMTVTVASGTTPGSYGINVTGVGGTKQHSTALTLTVTPAPTFTISASSPSLTIVQGNHATDTITTSVSGGFNNSISLSASGLPSGATASFNPSTRSAPGAGTSTLTITAGSSTVPGTYIITVTGNGGTTQRSATVTLTVTGAPSFTISASPLTLSVVQGQQGTSTITTTAVYGFNSSIGVAAANLPAGTTASFRPAAIAAPGTGTATLTLTVGASTLPGTYNITVTGNGGNIQHSTTVALTVSGAPSFTISASPSTLNVKLGQQGTSKITTAAVYGFNSSVGLAISNLPPGTTASFTPSAIAAPGTGSSTLIINVGAATHAGIYTLTVTGSSSNTSKTTIIALTVPTPDFTISVTPTSQTVHRGSAAAYTVTGTVLNGFAGTVGLSISGCPSTTTCSFNPSSLTPPGTSTFKVATTTGTAMKSYTITITASQGSLSHSASVGLTVGQ